MKTITTAILLKPISGREKYERAAEKYGLNMKEASELLHIPYRTIQNWVGGTRTCPKYIIELVEFKLERTFTNGSQITEKH